LIEVDHVLLAYSKKGGTSKLVSSGPAQVFYNKLVEEGKDAEAFFDLCRAALPDPSPTGSRPS